MVLLSMQRVIFTQSKHFKSVLESQLLEKVAAANRDKVLHLSSLKTAAGSSLDERLRGALDLAKEKKSDKKPVIAICGSLFVAADAREALFR